MQFIHLKIVYNITKKLYMKVIQTMCYLVIKASWVRVQESQVSHSRVIVKLIFKKNTSILSKFIFSFYLFMYLFIFYLMIK